ncbi:MAG: hypothetical protein LBU43_05860 [Candidatus Accumulibacter sp.]|jgi:hypothetical protein|nr:hypothetical protein [Accumulibacter sp.]
MNKKLIFPAEIKICATCSFWDGIRKIDPELAIVVVEESCEGECLVEHQCRLGLTNEFAWHDDCLWEHLAPDAPEIKERKNPV